jgi:radical SAM superfamily enzyme YgiQ (UPF0313 family)
VNLSEKFSPFILEYNINQTAEDIFADIIKSDFDVVAFSCYIWNVEKTLEVAGRIKALRPDVKIILGGPEVSYDAEELLLKNTFIDFVLGGEGE